MKIHPFDAILNSSRPVVTMPVHGEFVPMEEDGDRILLAKNGIFMEVKRPWVEGVVKVAKALPVSVPWGEAKQGVRFLCGAPPKRLLKDFEAFARSECPNECGAILTWTEEGEWRIRLLESEFASESYLRFIRPRLDEGEHLIVDVHSHGRHTSHFSSKDDEQDSQGELKISGVYGSLDSFQACTAWRICFNGYLTGENSSIYELMNE